MKRTQTITIALISSVLVIHAAGCGNKFFDPAQIGRFRPTPAVNVILDSLGVAEETPAPWKRAEDPRPSDIVAVETDYVFQPGDIVRISIFELFLEGAMVASDYIVTETGKISIPDVGVVQAAGLTETQLEEEIKRILSPNILKEPSVNVTMLSSQQRTYSILGNGVPRPGRYVIPRYDFRLTDALATAGGPAQFNVSYIYVSRRANSKEQVPDMTEPQAAARGLGRLQTVDPRLAEPEFVEPGRARPRVPQRTAPRTQTPGGSDAPKSDEQKLRLQLEREMLDMITPQAGQRWPESKKVVVTSSELAATDMSRWPSAGPHDWPTASQPLAGRDLARASARPVGTSMLSAQADQDAAGGQIEWTFRDGRWVPVPVTPRRSAEPVAPEVRTPDRSGEIEWTFRDGQWVAVPVAPRKPAAAVLPEVATAERSGEIEWTFRDGRWVPIQVTPRRPAEPVAPEAKTPARTGEIEWTFQDGRWVPIQVAPPTPEAPKTEKAEGGGRVEWIFEDGKWVPIQVGPPRPTEPVIKFEPEGAIPLEGKLAEELEWEKAVQARVIKIPATKLLAGDPRYNLVIKPGDTIHVPVDIIGEFCIMGNVNYRGYIPITGRPMTLKMAIAAAGGLGSLAWPKRCEVIRRISEDKEEIVMVDLDKIAMGEQPDFFIKPNDLINVGTHATARWRAILRNAFRATYGFGFVYDRNFADADYGKGFRTPHWF